MSKLLSWREMPIGGVIFGAGTSEEYKTGGWRTYKPIHDAESCTDCLLCWILCPDSAVQVKDGKVIGFDYEHCKGCGICAHECPPKCNAIQMELDDGLGSPEQ